MIRGRLAPLLGGLAFLGAMAALAGAWAPTLGRGFVTLVGLLALVVALATIGGRRSLRRLARLPERERRDSVPTPGVTPTDVLEELRPSLARPRYRARYIRDGLRTAAITALDRFDGESPATARDRVETGTWTDDRVAASFLSESNSSPASSGLRRRLASFVGESPYRSAVRRTVGAIDAVATDGDEGRSLPEYDFARDGPSGDERGNRARRRRAPNRGSAARAAGRPTAHWAGIGFVALFAVGLGAVAESAAVVLAGVVGVGYAGFAGSFEPPTPELSLRRTVSDERPEPGDEIDVRTTITNESDAFVPDLRLVDGVPSGCTVTEGSSRIGTALRPGESVALEYAVVVGRGRHEFEPAVALVRDLSRSLERESRVATETTVVCEPDLRPLPAGVPLRSAAIRFSGRLSTTEPGSGTTFHSVREYRPSDPLARIDWKRRARTGELATVEFHEERAARVLLVIDARESAYRAPEPGALHAVDRSVAAAGRIAATLLEDGDAVGLAALGGFASEGAAGDGPCWLEPSSGREHELLLRERLTTHPQLDSEPSAPDRRWHSQLRTIRRRLTTNAQVVFLTPLCDPDAARIARRFEARGYPVTVVSPDPTADRTASQVLARLLRRTRCGDLRRAGIPVVDWPSDASLEVTFARYASGGGR